MGSDESLKGKLRIDPKSRRPFLADLRTLIRLAPADPFYRLLLGQMLLAGEGSFEEALKEYQEAFRLEPQKAQFHEIAATDLANFGHLDRAIEEAETAIRLNPRKAQYSYFLGSLRLDQSRPDLAFTVFRDFYLARETPNSPDQLETSLSLDNDLYVPWGVDFNEMRRPFVLLTNTGSTEQVIATLQERLKLDPEDRHNSLMLGEWLQATGKVDDAITLFQNLIQRKPNNSAEYHYGLSLAKRAQGDSRGADEAYHEAVRQKSNLVARMVLLRSGSIAGEGLLQVEGRIDEAIHAHRQASEFAKPGTMLDRVLRFNIKSLEQKSILEKRQSAVLKGAEKPADNSEKLALAGSRSKEGKFVEAARLWSEIFAADPSLANSREPQHRYRAACAAVLAGCGAGKNEVPPDEGDRKKFRDQARDWLRSDLTLYARQAETGTDASRKQVADRMKHWQKDDDLTSVRDPEPLAKLPEAERKEWQALWAEVDALIARAAKPGG